MSDTVIKIKNLSKQYRLGLVGTGTISHDLNRWWYKIRGKEDPYLKINDSPVKSIAGDDNFEWALKNINLEVKKGEILGIIGKNGAGKSTLLKILSRVTGPTLGDIKVRGRIGSLLEVGTGFHPELTGKENIFLNGAILGMTKNEITSKLDEIVEFSGTSKYIDTPVKRYSSGMRVRLAFAVAAHLEPEILVVDEVLAVGDAEFQKKAIGKMGEISSSEGRTILFVSHNMMAVRNLCHKCLVLKDGEIIFNGLVDDAIDHYLKEYSEVKLLIRYDVENAPGNVEAKFLRAEVTPLEKKEWPLQEGDGFHLEFDFLYTGKKNSNLDVSFHLKDEYGNLVFVGTTRANPPKYFGTGLLKANCDVPANFMHHGNYTISAILLIRNRGERVLGIPNSLSFEVIPKASKDLGWMGKKLGIVKPELNWDLSIDLNHQFVSITE